MRHDGRCDAGIGAESTRRQSGRGVDIAGRFVAVSAGGEAARAAAIGAGADFFLDKPMRLADIVDTIRRLTRA